MATDRIMDYHGDDYGISMNNAARMLELIKAGRMDSISVIPNMTTTDEALKLLNDEWDGLAHKPKISVHINLVDGFSLSGIEDEFFTSKLTDSDAEYKYVFHTSWAGLLLGTLIPGSKRDRIEKILTKEIRLQIDNVYSKLPKECKLRIDAHQHTQMIPVVFDAVMNAVDELGLNDDLEFVRISREPVFPFMPITGTFPPVSLVKNILLNMLSKRNEKKLKSRGAEYGLLWGLIMTGCMDKKRVEALLPAMTKYAEKKGKTMEVLFHPGIVAPDEKYAEYGPDDMEHFYSGNRDIEYDAVMNAAR